MKISSVKTCNVAGLPDLDLRFAGREHAPAKIVVVTGGAACGKSRLLEAIATAKEVAAPYGPRPSTRGWVQDGYGEARIDVEWWLASAEQTEAGLDHPAVTSEVTLARDALAQAKVDPGLAFVLGRYEHDRAAGKVDLFRADRSLSDGTPLPDFLFDQRSRRLVRGNGKYAALAGFCTRAVREQTAQGRELAELFAELCPGRVIDGVMKDGALAFAGARGRVGLAELADSEKMAFLFAATMVAIGLHQSVVLVDSPELHRGPGGGARMLAVLAAYAPSNQWVVATTDREVVAMAETVVTVGGDK